MDSLRLCAIRCLVTGEGLLSSGDPIDVIRRSVGDDTGFFRLIGTDSADRSVISAVLYAVDVRLERVEAEGLR